MEIKGICSAKLVKETRKSLSIRVFPDMRVIIKVPEQATDHEINIFINKKRTWLIKQLAYFKQFCNCMVLTKLSGSSMLYLGRQYKLLVIKSLQKNIKIEKNKIVLYVPFVDKDFENKKILEEWLNKRASTIFQERLIYMHSMFDKVPLPQIKIRKLSRRWGSYLHKTNTIILNPCLIQAQKPAIDFIIAHELCHYYYKEHNSSFYNLLESKVPNWKQIESKMEQKLLANN